MSESDNRYPEFAEPYEPVKGGKKHNGIIFKRASSSVMRTSPVKNNPLPFVSAAFFILAVILFSSNPAEIPDVPEPTPSIEPVIPTPVPEPTETPVPTVIPTEEPTAEPTEEPAKIICRIHIRSLHSRSPYRPYLHDRQNNSCGSGAYRDRNPPDSCPISG